MVCISNERLFFFFYPLFGFTLQVVSRFSCGIIRYLEAIVLDQTVFGILLMDFFFFAIGFTGQVKKIWLRHIFFIFDGGKRMDPGFGLETSG